ncbi:hypothetical protein CLOM_g23548 [Closterium sp. NIES-68]|nr:hypothetical protein CLOM_g23548 [Closterium sp. NIES-68]GJP71535.1 hypothetical protein CLOP_g2361 [Closterium sp. NIES-67]
MADARVSPLVATTPFLARRSSPSLAALRVDFAATFATLSRLTSAKSQPSASLASGESRRLRRSKLAPDSLGYGHRVGTAYDRSSGFGGRAGNKGHIGDLAVTAAAGNRWFQGGSGRQNNRFGGGSGGSDGGSGEESRMWRYPWESGTPGDASWEVRRESITFFTSEGVFQIHDLTHVPAPSLPPPSSALSTPAASPPASSPSSSPRRFSERRYMDPHQGLCLASLFDIRAFNGLDASRLFCVVGFCRSPEMLSDVVQDTVLMAGGEVVDSKLEMGQGLHEHLRLTVALPFLFGVPPALDSLNRAIRLGGGIVDKSYHQWEMCP